MRFHLIMVVALLAAAAGARAQTAPEARVGIQTPQRVLLTLREAVVMAVENNRDIAIERLNLQMDEFDLKAAKGAYDPALTSSLLYERQTLPVASVLAG